MGGRRRLDRGRGGDDAGRRQARRRDPRRHRVLPARERRVDPGGRAPRLEVRHRRDEPGPHRLPARRRADRDRQGEDRRGRAEARGAALRRAAAGGTADAAVRQGGAARPRLPGRLARLHGPDPADELRGLGRLGQARARDHGLGGRRDADQAHRRPRLQHRCLRGLQRHRHQAAVRHRAPRPRPPRGDLPRGDGRADAADRRLLRLHGRRGLHLPAGEGGRHGLLELDLDPDRAHVRRRHRLLPAAGLTIARGAAPHRGQARGDGACAEPFRPGDPRQRADRDPGDAGPGLRGLAQHVDPRPRRRDRGCDLDARRAHAAAVAADDLRPPWLLAAPGDRRLRPRERRGPASRGVAALRRSDPPSPGPGAAGDRRVSSSPGRSACSRSRSTTRRRPSSRSRSRRSRASSCWRRRSRPACSRR